MNTQERVLAMLNKIENVRTAKKENLGAIEDAVNEVKSNLETRGNDIIALVNELGARLEKGQQDARALAEDLQNSLQEIGMQYNEGEAEYLDIAQELDALGISYDSIFPDIGSDYNDTYELIDNLIFNLGN